MLHTLYSLYVHTTMIESTVTGTGIREKSYEPKIVQK